MKHCISCGKELPEQPLFVLESAPASAQDIPDSCEVKTDRGVTLNLCQCVHCGLVQFDCIPVSYYKDVIRAGGFSTTMTEFRRRQYRHLIETYHLEGKKFLEVGCGRGEFLQVLREFPVEVYGMEHKEDLVKIAVESGLNVWREFPDTEAQKFGHTEEQSVAGIMEQEFTDAADRKTAADAVKGPFDVFLSFNFLEHQPHPDVMLRAIYNNLTENGMGLVTVPSLEYILEQGSYYELIRDHIAYYSFDTLRNLLERCGFQVLEEEIINRDTIAMIVKKVPADDVDADETGGAESVSVDSMIEGYDIVIRDIAEIMKILQSQGRRLAIWGASHQGFTLAATTALGGFAEYVIDSAPFKQGRFAPASHLPIVAPDAFFENPVDAILIAAPGYTDEIAGIIRQRFGAGVQIMTLRTNHIEQLENT